METKHNWFISILFILGIALIISNVSGLFTSLRAPELVSEINTINKNDLTISEAQIYSAFNADILDKKTYVKSLNATINQGIAHYWEDDGIEKYNLRIPFQENYILFITGYLMPDKFLKYEFMDYRRGIERGVGLCSQQSIILSELLYLKGIKSKIVGLSGHVVSTALVDDQTNEWWVLDPDYGVVIPFDIESIEKNPEIVTPFYLEKGYKDSTISVLEGLYDKDGNFVTQGYGEGNYSLIRYYFEQVSYVLIWILPILLMLPFIFIHGYKRIPNRK